VFSIGEINNAAISRRKNVEIIRCYRFVKDDCTSVNGEMSWSIGEWKKVNGKIVCCSNGLHAALTPRDSLRNVYGQRWFISEARGELVKQNSKFAASEMRIVQEIPAIVLQRFAIWCATDCLKYYEKACPEDKRVGATIEAAQGYLDGEIKIEELMKHRESAGAAIGCGAAARAVATAIAAALSAGAPNTAAWANVAAASAYAAHALDAVHVASISTADALMAAHNVASLAAAAVKADDAAALARTAAGAGAAAHAAAVAAARNVPLPDTPADAYYAAYSAYSSLPSDTFSFAQNQKLSELIDQATVLRKGV
jgi:hypothetical protein